MIFKTFDNDIDKMSSKWGMFGKSFSDIGNNISTKWKQVDDYIAVTNDATISGITSAWKDSSPLEFLETSQVESILKNYNKALDQGAEKTAEFINAGTGNDFVNGFLKDLNGLPATMDKYNTAVKSAEVAQKGLTASMVASKVAAMAMNVAISMGVSIAISALVKVVDNLVHANEKAIESAEELRKKYDDFKETNALNVSTLKDLKDEFDTLSKGVSQYGDNISLTTDEYARYKEIIQQIVGMSPSLSEGYSTENGYIADKNGLLERAIELQEQEYKNELRKITNLDNLKTSMSGYIAEYKEAFNGGLVTDDGSATATREFTDMQNAIYELFNTNNRNDFSSEDMVKQIMSSLGVEDVENEIAKYYNEHGYFQSSDFWNDYADTIAENIQVIDDSLSADSVGLDSTVFDQNIQKVESCAQSYTDMKDSISLANELIQSDLGYIAEYVNGYSELTSAQEKFVSEYLKGYDISDITSTDYFGNLVYDEDKMATVKSQIVKFVEELSKDTTTKDALENLYAPPTDNESVSKYVARIKTAIEAIQAYCTENGINIPISLENISGDTDALVNNVKGKLQDEFDDKVGTLSLEDLDIASKLEIDPSVPISWDELIAKIKEYKDSLKEGTEPPTLSTSDAIKNLEELETKMKSLDGAMAELIDPDDGKIDLSTLDGLRESLESLEGVDLNILNSALEQLSNATNVEDVQSAMNDLANEYLRCSGILDGLTDSNANLIAAQLQEIGITNANEIVTARLAAQKYAAANGCADLTNATYGEIAALIAEGTASSETAQYLSILALEKLDVNSIVINTDDDVNAIIAIANAAGASAAQLAVLQNALAQIGNIESAPTSPTAGVTSAIGDTLKNAQLDAWKSQVSSTITDIQNGKYNIDPSSFYANYSGGSQAQAAKEQGKAADKTGDAADKLADAADAMADTFYAVFDWMEKKVERMKELAEAAADKVKDSIQYASDKNFVNQTFSRINDEMAQNAYMTKRYQKSANDTGLAKEWKDKVKGGATIDYSEITDQALNDQIKAYEDWYKKSQDAKKANEDLKDSIEEVSEAMANAPIEKATEKIEKYTTAIDLLNAKADNRTSASSKNSLLDKIDTNVEKQLSAYQTAYKATQGNLKSYTKSASGQKVAKNATKKQKETYKKLIAKVKTATSSKKVISDKDLDAVYNYCNSIQDFTWYQNCVAYNQALEANQSAKDTYEAYIQEAQSIKADNAKTRFDNIQTEYENKQKIQDQRKTKLENTLSLIEAQGNVVTTSYYDNLIANENSQINSLETEKNKLQQNLSEEVANGNIKKGSEEWQDMCDSINDVTNAIDEATVSVAEYQQAIKELNWENFDRMEEAINRLNEESQFYIDLMSHMDLINEDGGLSEYGVATQGLYAQQYETYMSQARDYQAQIDALKATGELSVDDSERLYDLEDSMRENILSAYDAKDAFIDLAEDGLNSLQDALDNTIDKFKELLEAERDEFEYQQAMKDRAKELAALQKQLAAYTNDTSEQTQAKVQSLKVDIESAQQDIQDAQYDKYVEDTGQMLSDLSDDFGNYITQAVKDLSDNFSAEISKLTDSNSSILATLNKVSTDVGAKFGTELQSVFTSGTYYNGVLGASDSIKASINKMAQIAQQKIDEANAEKVAQQNSAIQASGYSVIKNIYDSAQAENSHVESMLDDNSAQIAKYQAQIKANKTLINKKGTSSDQKKDLQSMNKSIQQAIDELKKSSDTIIQNSVGVYTKYGVADFLMNNLQITSAPRDSLSTLNKALYDAFGQRILSNDAIYQLAHLYGMSTDAQLYEFLHNIGFYKSGAKRIDTSQLAITQDGGQELIARASDGGLLTRLNAGDKVFTSKMTDNLWDIAKNYSGVLSGISIPDLNVASLSRSPSSPISISIGDLNLPNVTNAEQFADELTNVLKTPKIQKQIQSITTDRLVKGNNSLKVRSF